MKQIFVFAAIAIVCISCGKKKEETHEKSTLSYEMKVFRLESEGGCTSDTLSCASYEINYPVFTGLSSAANDSLQKKIADAVSTGNPELDSSSFRLDGKSFIDDFNKAKKEFPNETIGWYYKANIEVRIAADTLISLEANSDYFTGGAHGGSGVFFVNIDPASGKNKTLKDVLKPGFEEPLRKAAETEFKKLYEISDTTSYTKEGFEFPDDKFQLNDNYGFSERGIKFVFNNYEIAPYAMGAQEFFIPYQKIKDWLK